MSDTTVTLQEVQNQTPVIGHEAAVALRRKRLPKWIWLAAAAGLFSVADGRNTIALAAWLAPMCLMRFVRIDRPWRGLSVAYIVLVVMRGIAYRGMTPIPGIFYYIFLLISSVSALVPYLIDRLCARRLKGITRTLVFPSTLVSMQFIYSHGPHGSWGNLAYTQAGNLPLLQLLSVTGLWGITFLIGWFASVANEVLEQLRVVRSLLIFAIVYLTVILGGEARLAFFHPTSSTVRVASLSPANKGPSTGPDLLEAILAGRANEQEIEGFRTTSLQAGYELIARSDREAVAGAKIILWSETAVYILAQDEPALLNRGRDLATKYRVYLAMALGTWTPGGKRPLQNKIVVIDPTGRVAFQYLKARPTPGPEAQTSVKSDGKLRWVDTPYGRLLGAICFDMDFPPLMSQASSDGADIVLSPAADWRAIDPRHTEIASFRSIEQGFNLVRQSKRGLSAAYDYQGHVLASMDEYSSPDLTLVAQVPTHGVRTLYSRCGEWVAWSCIFGTLLLAGMACRSTIPERTG